MLKIGPPSLFCLLDVQFVITPPRHSHAPPVAGHVILRQLGALKVKEIPKFLQDKVTVANVTSHAPKFIAEYKTNYRRGIPDNIYHVMCGVFVTAYITVWPTEYRHMMAAKHGHLIR